MLPLSESLALQAQEGQRVLAENIAWQKQQDERAAAEQAKLLVKIENGRSMGKSKARSVVRFDGQMTPGRPPNATLSV